jgi:hypothetical protein
METVSNTDLNLEQRVREDLLDSVDGVFSAADSQEIRRIADHRWKAFQSAHMDPRSAWQATVHDFVSSSFWGFHPYARSIAKPKGINLGIQYILIVFLLFTFGITGLVWFGQIYTNDGEPLVLAAFFLVIATIVSGVGWFVWRNYD